MGIRLKRKIETILESYYLNDPGKIMIVNGARQTGKSFSIRESAKAHFKNYVEINLFEDKMGPRIFAGVDTVAKFSIAIGLAAGFLPPDAGKDTLIFLDEIQEYPDLIPLLKFINASGPYRYIASGSALGVELSRSSSIPMGSISIVNMYPLDFEEYLWAKGTGSAVIDYLRECFSREENVDENVHRTIMAHLASYLVTGGLPDVVARHVEGESFATLRTMQYELRSFYAADCSKYDSEHRLQIMRIYNLLPSFMEQRKKRVVYKKIDPSSARSDKYAEEFDYLISSGVAIPVLAVSNPVFPLLESSSKNLLKLYMNDVGLLSAALYGNNVNAVLDGPGSVNLGSLYETFVSMELHAHSHELFYYDNRAKGKVDFLLNDHDNLSILPIEVKSGRDYQIHSSISSMIANGVGGCRKGLVLSNSRDVRQRGGIVYLPVYDCMFI